MRVAIDRQLRTVERLAALQGHLRLQLLGGDRVGALERDAADDRLRPSSISKRIATGR